MTSRPRCGLGVVVVTLFAAGAARGAEFTPIAGFEEQLFPSYLIATASMKGDKSSADPHRLGDPRGILGVEIVSPGAKTPIKVTVECDEYFAPSVFSGTLAEEGETYSITPKIKYKYDHLAQCEQASPVSVTFRVQVGKEEPEEQTVTCTMRSINDCPFAFRNGETVIDVSFAFAAYVNEQHPFVDKLLREALDRGVVESFQGYQAGTPEDVIKQAYAIWDLLVARDIRYSSITTTAAASDSVASQHVRLIEDSINNSQANCVDGSVLWVSMLRKISVDGFLVVTPNHCYAGFYLDPQQQTALAIETTLLGATIDEGAIEVSEIYDAAISQDLRYDVSFPSFVAALEHGTKTFSETVKNGEVEEGSGIQVIDIATMRKAGVLPIPFQNKEEFVSYDFTTNADDAPIEEETGDAVDEEPAVEEEAVEETVGATTPKRKVRRGRNGMDVVIVESEELAVEEGTVDVDEFESDEESDDESFDESDDSDEEEYEDSEDDE